MSCLFERTLAPFWRKAWNGSLPNRRLPNLIWGSDRGRLGQTIARLLLLPLADDAGNRTLLGALSFVPEARSACKFQVLARREERVAPLAVVPVNPALAPQETGVPLRRRGHLTLVHFSE